MTRSPAKLILLLFVAVAALAAVDRFALNGFAGDAVRRTYSAPAGYAFGRLEYFRALVQELGSGADMAGENAWLKEENQRLSAGLAYLEAVEDENEFLRTAAGIAAGRARPPVLAATFGASLGPDGYIFLVNKGAAEGVAKGDVVVSGSRVLVGSVVEAWEHTSRIFLLSDPSFSVTAKIVGAGTTGVVRGSLDDDMPFDLIVPDDPVQEGDTVVSSGNDRFPAGLIIGTVSRVLAEQSDVFKKVRVKPALRSGFGKVLILGTQ